MQAEPVLLESFNILSEPNLIAYPFRGRVNVEQSEKPFHNPDLF